MPSVFKLVLMAGLHAFYSTGTPKWTSYITNVMASVWAWRMKHHRQVQGTARRHCFMLSETVTLLLWHAVSLHAAQKFTELQPNDHGA